MFNISHFLKVFFPNIASHFFAGRNRDGANRIQVSEDQFPYSLTKLGHSKIFQFFSLFSNYLIGYMPFVIVTQGSQIFFVDISFAIFSDYFYEIVIKGDFCFIFKNLIHETFALIFTPKKRKNLIDNIRFKIFMSVSKFKVTLFGFFYFYFEAIRVSYNLFYFFVFSWLTGFSRRKVLFLNGEALNFDELLFLGPVDIYRVICMIFFLLYYSFISNYLLILTKVLKQDTWIRIRLSKGRHKVSEIKGVIERKHC